MLHIEQIESKTPFSHELYVRVGLYHLDLNGATVKDQIEQRYLAWQTVRKKTNPYFVEGTGFEGYLVGTCTSSLEALETILKVGQHILDAIAHLYRFESDNQSRLMRTLSGDFYDAKMTHIWSSYLGAELGMLRTHVPRNKAAVLFQTQTYQIVSLLPRIKYRPDHQDLMQKYAIGFLDASVLTGMSNPAKIDVRALALTDSQQLAWHVVSHVGQFGHPLVRKYLDKW